MRFFLAFLFLFFSAYSHAWDVCGGYDSYHTVESLCATDGGHAYNIISQTSVSVTQQCITNSGGIYGPITCYNNSQCPSGQELNITTGVCQSACPDGSTRDAAGNCKCGPGEFFDAGTLVDALNGYPQHCSSLPDLCGRRAGQNYVSFNSVMSSDGCAVTCALSTGTSSLGVAHFVCTYTGAVAGNNSGATAPIVSPDTPVEVPGVPQLPLPPVWYPRPEGGCNAGDASGQINGVNACVPQSKPDGTPNTPTSSPSNTQSQVTVTNTATQTNSDGSTTTITTSTTTTVGSTSGASSGGTSGSGTSANQCDPTKSDYAHCIHMADEVKSGVDGSHVGGGGGGDGNGTGNQTYSRGVYTDWFGTSELDQQIEQGKQQLKDSFNNLRSSISDGMTLNGSAALPDFGSVTVLGASIPFDIGAYSAQLSPLAQAIIFCSMLISAIIILRR